MRAETRVRPTGPVATAVVALGILAAASVGVAIDPDTADAFPGVWMVSVVTFGATGAWILLVQPRNRIGWIFVGSAGGSLLSGLLMAVGVVSQGWVGAWLPAVGNTLNTLAVLVFVTSALLLVPDGRLASPRWRRVYWVVGATALVGGASAIVTGGWGGDIEQSLRPSPLMDRFGDVAAVLSGVFFPLFLVSVLLASASAVVRFRRSRGTGRAQLKWVAYAVSLGAVLLVVSLLDLVPEPGDDLVASVALGLLPVGVAVAVVRHGLWDIDVVISRTLTYGALAGFITLLYVTVVVGAGSLVGAGDEPSLALQIVATALVAVLFQPVRRRLERYANRLVFGRRATPYEVLSAFSRHAAANPDESSLPAIVRLLADGTGAESASVWLRVHDSFRRVASHPPGSSADPVDDPGDGSMPDLPGEFSVPVTHDGLVLGALTVSSRRGDQLSGQDVEIAHRLAAGVGVALHNVRLTAELRDRLDDLRVSRRRIVSAQDNARRRLERDLHDGAQQQLVALKVKLRLACQVAEERDAPKTAAILAQVVADADGAVKTLRELAGGIYPPLLESDGLLTALDAQARKAAIPVTVHGHGIGRYGRDIEAAIYFCVLEAINNVAKYAHARSVFVRLDDDGRVLSFVVEDDGVGFDPSAATGGSGIAGMTDRLDDAGGSLTIESTVGRGTIVRGEIPVLGLEHVGGGAT